MTMLGVQHKEETKEKIRKAHLGKHKPWAGKYKHAPLSQAHRDNIAKGLLGRTVSGETKKKIAKTLAGHKHSEETLDKIRAALKGKQRGENHWNWQGGAKAVSARIRKSAEYGDWRKAVFDRDNYTCQNCGSTKVKLHAHHIKRFSDYPDLRFEILNGSTLCVPCHRKTDTYGNRKLADAQ